MITLQAKDLSLEAIRRQVHGLLPLRDLTHRQPLAAYLDRMGQAYRRKARQA